VHIMHYEKEVVYGCNMCMQIHMTELNIENAHIIVTNLDMSYIWWAEKYG